MNTSNTEKLTPFLRVLHEHKSLRITYTVFRERTSGPRLVPHKLHSVQGPDGHEYSKRIFRTGIRLKQGIQVRPTL